MCSQIPEKSGFPSGILGAGRERWGVFFKPIHCAVSGVQSAAQNVDAVSSIASFVIFAFMIVPLTKLTPAKLTPGLTRDSGHDSIPPGGFQNDFGRTPGSI